MSHQESQPEKEGEEDHTNPYAEGTVGLMFLEKLCLAIIRAHPPTKDDKRTEAQRLREAMYALKPDYYRHEKHDTDDRLLLYWMAAQWVLKHSGIRALKAGPSLFGEDEPKAVFEDEKDLAKAALRRFGTPDTGIKAGVKRLLSKKFADDEPKEKKRAKWARYQERLKQRSMLPPEQQENVHVKMPPLTNWERLMMGVIAASPNPHIEDHRILLPIVDLLRQAEVPAIKPLKPTAF